MKHFSLCILFALICSLSFSQPFIHAHNDYQKPEPLTYVLRYQAFSIEADIFLSENRLLVAHEISELSKAKTLDSFYLQPIIELFRKNGGTISADSNYAPVLMIDIKNKGEETIAALIKLLAPYRNVFDRTVNAKAVQVVLSGDRGASAKWVSCPSFILFDGRPGETYDNVTLNRVAFISDSWLNYALPPKDNYERLKPVIDKVHQLGKYIRLWGSPDNPDSWKRQLELGIDIINTDKVAECREYILKISREKN
jgi:hypothetical protein